MRIFKKWGERWVELHSDNIPEDEFEAKVEYAGGVIECKMIHPATIDPESMLFIDPSEINERRYTHVGFMLKMGVDNVAAIKDSNDTKAQVYWEMFMKAEYISNKDPLLRGGLMYFEDIGLIPKGTTDAVLA